MFDITGITPHFPVALNFVSALVPLALSFFLFRSRGRRNILWWGGAFVWFAFLPTAPYTLTDVIHLIAAIRETPYLPLLYIILILIPLYGLYWFISVQSYVISLLMLDNYLAKEGLRHYLLPIELVVHLACAIGIYLGRFPPYLFSWDLVTNPLLVLQTLLRVFQQPIYLLFIILAFAIVAGIYYILKMVDVAVWQAYIKPRLSKQGA